ncbi:MAG: hypothetical protein GF331_05495 [Chitinivibrionales bacterium]|nr:hypothetical protein [Chitinivibrionales bacterium]
MQKQYWAFYWPLTLTGFAMLLSKQFENGVLARYPDAATELAIFAYAWSTFFLFNAALVFVPQVVTRLAKTPADRDVCQRFLWATCLVLTLPLLVASFTPFGASVIDRLFDLKGRELAAVVTYLRFLTPMILINGFRLFYVGVLVQERRTRTVTILNVAYLSTIVTLLTLGFRSGWRPVITLAVAQLSASSLHLLLGALTSRLGRKAGEGEREQAVTVTYREVFSFFWPVALTSTMFAFSRPIMYSFVSRTPDAITTVAALRVAFDLAMIFHNPMNQSRHLFVTFGLKDRAGLQIFVTRVMIGLSAIMVLVAATPVLDTIMARLLGVDENIRAMARGAFWVLCLVPLTIGLRNMVHGTAMVKKRTTGMAIGGISRNVVIYVSSWACYRAGILNHLSAAGILVAGFAAEGIVVTLWLRSVERVRGPMLRADFVGAIPGAGRELFARGARRTGIAAFWGRLAGESARDEAGTP